MKKFVFTLLIVTVAVTLNAMSDSPQTISFAKDDHDRHVQLKTHQKFTVTLPANPSTGYRWTIDETSFDCFRESRPDTFLLRSSAKKEGAILVGAGGHQQFFFQAAKPGDGVLRLKYHRSWEKKQPPADTFQLHIKIRN